MKRIGVVCSLQKLKRIPFRYLFLEILLLIISVFCVLLFFFRQYETIYNTDHVTGVMTDLRCIDTFNAKGSRVLLTFEVDGQQYYLWYPNDGRRQHEKVLELDFNTNKTVVELRVSKQFARNRVVDFRSGDEVFYSMETENTRIQQERISALIAGVLMAVFVFFTSGLLFLSYGVLKFVYKI